ncbi:MAG: NUDIX hydrolase [Candidatus Tectomicrobia bacterium]|nr:NUDIX hydrolase [Candidatus Tectomicrobia bacterium]
MNLEQHETLHIDEIYRGKYLALQRQTIRLPNQRVVLREVVIPPNAVAMLPLDSHGLVYMIRQYRPAAKKVLLEIPAGILDPEESPEETARRELIEEVGKSAATLTHLFRYYHAEGYSTGVIDLYLATHLSDASSPVRDTSELLEVVPLPFQEVYEKVLRKEIVDSKSLLAIMRTAMLMKEPGFSY